MYEYLGNEQQRVSASPSEPRPPRREFAHERSAISQYMRFVVRHRIIVVVATLAVSVFLGTQLRNLHLEIKRRGEVPDGHPNVQIQNRITDVFGGETVAIIGLIAKKGDIFNPSMLNKVYRITQRLLAAPSVVAPSVLSLASPYTKTVIASPDGAVDARPLMREAPTTQDEVRRIHIAVRGDRVIRNNLISDDETATVIIADFNDHIKDSEIPILINEIINPERDDTVIIATAGAPILRAELVHYTTMMVFLFPLCILAIGFLHYEAFRTVQAMLLPLVTAVLSVVWGLGIMGLLHQPMDTWSAVSPIVLLAIAAGHAVQILKRYYEEFARTHCSREAVVRSMVAVGPVMLTAGLVAAAGFASLITFDIPSVRAFGLLLSSGIVSALVIEMTFTPACRSLLPSPRSREISRERTAGRLDHVLDRLSDVVVDRPKLVLTIAAAFLVLFAIGATKIHVDNSFRLWFSKATKVRQDDAILNEKLAGTSTLRILIEGAQENAILQPAVLRAISDLDDELARNPQIGSITSIADYVKRMNQAMHDGDEEYYTIPNDAAASAQYLFLYTSTTGPDGLSSLIDSNNRGTVIRALSKTDSGAFSRDLLERLQRFATERFKDLPVKVGIAGGTLGVQTAMNDVVVREKIYNVVVVGAIIFGLCAIVFRSIAAAAFVLVPLTMAVVANLGTMGWSGIWLEMSTAAFTAMGISIGADFAIYMLFRMREEHRFAQSLEGAIRASMRTSGKALAFVSSAVAVGYLMLTLSGFSIWIRLGVLTALMVSVSALASLTVLPAATVVLRPAFVTRFKRGKG